MEFDVSEDGILTVDDQQIPLGISYTSNANDFVKEGAGLFRPGEEAEVLADARTNPAVNFDVKQNFLEGSNVDPAKTMTEMMNTYRSFEMNQRVLKAYDQSMQKAVNEIARLQ